jgi:hypothetical protein
MPSKLKPLVLLGIAGGIVAAVRKRANPEQLQQAASQAAGAASDLADKAKEAVTGNGDDAGSRDETRRDAAPAEASAQPPSEPGGAPSDEPQATVARSVPKEETKP